MDKLTLKSRPPDKHLTVTLEDIVRKVNQLVDLQNDPAPHGHEYLLTRVHCFAYLNASMTSLSAGWNQVQLNAVKFNPGSHFSTSAYVFTAPVSGYYKVSGHARITNASGAVRDVGCAAYVGGSYYAPFGKDNAFANSRTAGMGGSALVYCTAGQAIGLYVNVDAATSMTIVGGASVFTWMSVQLVAVDS